MYGFLKERKREREIKCVIVCCYVNKGERGMEMEGGERKMANKMGGINILYSFFVSW